MRFLILKLAASLACLIAGGCVYGVEKPEEILGHDEHVVIEPSHHDYLPATDVAFSMDAAQFATLAHWLGNNNTITLENAVHIQHEQITLDAVEGTRVTYRMEDTSGVFTFDKPYPVIKMKLTRLIGGVSLHEITINSDGTGLAKTGLGSYPFRWLDDGGGSTSSSSSTRCDCGCGTDGCACRGRCVPAPTGQGAGSPSQYRRSRESVNAKPIVFAYSTDGCAPCETAKRELASDADKLPFTVVWKTDKPPCVTSESFPIFWWHISANEPTCADAANTRVKSGYTSVRDLVETWKGNRQ